MKRNRAPIREWMRNGSGESNFSTYTAESPCRTVRWMVSRVCWFSSRRYGQAQAANIKLPYGGLTNREARDPEVMGAFSIAVQETGSDQICQEAMNRAHRQPRQSRHLLWR